MAIAKERAAEQLPELHAPYPSWETFLAVLGVIKRRSPTSVDSKTLEEWGLSKPNAQKVLPALRFLGIVGQDGSANSLWTELAAKDPERYKKAVEGMIKQAYSKLFNVYPEILSESDERLSDAIGDVYKTSASTRGASVKFLKRLLVEAGLRKAEENSEKGQLRRSPVPKSVKSVRSASNIPPAPRPSSSSSAAPLQLHLHITSEISESELTSLLRKVVGAARQATEGNGEDPKP